jgi:flagellar L-ring protein precursor FlgH
MVGDPIAVKLDGDPQEQLSAKSKVISKLLAQLEERRRRALGRGPAGEENKDDKGGDKSTSQGQDKNAKPGATPDKNANAQNGASPNGQQPAAEENKDFNVKLVPTRVVERMVDGNYRVRGMQPFVIGNREYKVIVSGVVRAEDFNEEGINASQLIDSSFDIVSAKGTELRQ